MDFCVNPSKFSFPGRLILLSSSPNLLINLPDRNKQNPQRKYPLYLWPRSKVWMRAHKASIQTAAPKVTNIGDRLSSVASILPAANSYFVFNYFVLLFGLSLKGQVKKIFSSK